MSDLILPIEIDSFQKSYYMISRLGVGSFGCAILAKYRKDISMLLKSEKYKSGTLLQPLVHPGSHKPHSDGLVAIKVMKSQLKNPSDYLKVNEIKFILSVPSHHNLLQIFNLFIDSFSGKLNIVMEPMNQNLYQFMQKHEGRPLTGWVVKSMLAQLLNAIRHIHLYGYFHRDVKPENILVTSTKLYYGCNAPPEREKDLYILKLCDYGLSRHITNPKDLTQYVSTRWYRAPEILLRHFCYSRPIDIWAFATVAVELVHFLPLFPGVNEADQIWQILSKLGHPLYQAREQEDLGGVWPEGVQLAEKLGFGLPYFAPQKISSILGADYSDLSHTIMPCLLWDPKKRPTAEELSKAQYFKGTILEEDEVATCPQSQGSTSKPAFNGKESTVFNIQPKPSRKDVQAGQNMVVSADDQENGKQKIFDLHSDPINFYSNWSRSTCDADISGEVNGSLANIAVSNHPISYDFQIAQDQENQLIGNPSRVRFDDARLADTSIGSQEILC